VTGSPTVSVLVPTYNHRPFIAESLDSILSQDYDDMEVIVSDDASTDGAQAVLKTFADKYPDKLHVIFAKERGGISKNCNRAWRKCRGKYVALMSGDDIMLPGKLRKQVELMDADPGCSVSYHDLDVFDSDTRSTMYRWNETQDHKPRDGNVGGIIVHGTYIGACSSMVRRTSCPELGFDEQIPVASDWLFLIEAAAGGGTVRFLPEVLGGHRRHSSNVTSINRGLDEQFRTLEIVASKYPGLGNFVRRGRGRLYYAKAVESLVAGSGPDVRRYLSLSVRNGWYSWKCIIRWVQSFLPGSAAGGPV